MALSEVLLDSPAEKPSNTMPAKQMLVFPMFNFGKPRTAGQWTAHVVLGIIALFLVWWLLRLYVL